MRLFSIAFFFLISTVGFSQDGSDILYGEPKTLNESYIGKICHIDFGKPSGIYGRRNIDTIEINIKGKLISFVEHRVDNGYNNWFSKQYLEALPIKKNSSMRITSSRIDSLTSLRIYVTSFISYYHNDSPLDTITTIQHSYLRKNIAKVLFNAKQFKKE